MNTRIISRVIKYVCTTCFTVLFGGYYLYSNDFMIAQGQERYRLLSDAFAFPGYMMLLVSAFIWATNQGALDGISYCLKTAVSALIPGKRSAGYEKYGDYVEKMQKKRLSGYSFLLISGAIATAVSFIFLALFYYG